MTVAVLAGMPRLGRALNSQPTRLCVRFSARRNRVSPHVNGHVSQVFVLRFNRWDEICYDIIIPHPEEKTSRGIGRVRYA